jgi:hypothetical protein
MADDAELEILLTEREPVSAEPNRRIVRGKFCVWGSVSSLAQSLEK